VVLEDEVMHLTHTPAEAWIFIIVGSASTEDSVGDSTEDSVMIWLELLVWVGAMGGELVIEMTDVTRVGERWGEE
jgi:hypothetical protein